MPGPVNYWAAEEAGGGAKTAKQTEPRVEPAESQLSREGLVLPNLLQSAKSNSFLNLVKTIGI